MRQDDPLAKLREILTKQAAAAIQKDLKNQQEAKGPDEELEKRQRDHHKKEELENETINQLNQNLQAERSLKMYLSWATFFFMFLYTSIVLAILFKLPNPPNTVLISLIGTVPASMALFGWILRGLFPNKNNRI